MSNLQPTERDEASRLTPILERNIRALYERRVREQAQASGEEKLANTITTAIDVAPEAVLDHLEATDPNDGDG
jgi:hypothetical protein